MRKTLWDETARRALLERARQLTPESRPRWGSFTVERMLAHLVDAFRMVFGELDVPPKKRAPKILRLWPFNVLFVYVIGMPRNAPTPRQLIARPPDAIDEELRQLERVLVRCEGMERRREWPRHPFFGKLSARTWGVLGWKHMDHHLRQFGV